MAGAAAAFPGVHSPYDAVASWITEHGFAFAGPVQEIFRHWTGTPGHPDNRLEIAWPVDDATAGPDPAPGGGSSASNE